MSKSKVTIGQVFKTIIWPRKKLLFIGLILIIISRGAGLVAPWATKPFMDDILVKHDMDKLPMLLTAVIAAISIQAVTSFLLTKLLSVEAQHLISVLRSKVQKHLLRLPIRFFDNQKSGALVSRVMNDVEVFRNLVGTGLVQLIGGVLTAVISVGFLVYISPWMTVFVLLPMSIFGVITLKAFSIIRPVFRERGKITADVTGRLTETLNGIRVIKGFNAEPQEIKVFEDGVEKLFLNVKKSLTSTAIVTSSGAFLVGLASVGIMGLSGYFDLTAGAFLQFTLFMVFIIAPIVLISKIGSALTKPFAVVDRTQ